jgi:succinoglycan biosynthesis protein ExoM
VNYVSRCGPVAVDGSFQVLSYSSNMPKICILICTFDRPSSLRRLLSAPVVQAQLHGCTTIVVDNGSNSSEEIVSAFKASMNIVYERIAERGLVSARNRAMSLTLAFHPEFMAFIDDDEVPEADWLSNLIRRVEQTGADFACGPVVPEYEISPPRWVVEGEFFQNSGDTVCISNLLLRASCIPANESQWFQHEFNFSGGEDNELVSG